LPSFLLVVPNVTAHKLADSVGYQSPYLLHNGPLLCGFNVPIRVKKRTLPSIVE